MTRPATESTTDGQRVVSGSPSAEPRLGHLPGLDGLRALAVSAVFAYHAGVLPGGFLGVDVFFVISGFLITALAIGEIEHTGRFALGGFWARRARRLLPALYLLCAAVVAWSLVDGPVPASLGLDVGSTLLYVANWTRVGEGYDYFAAYVDPSLLEHTWSLAVEEQFYLVWPVIVATVVVVCRRRQWSVRVALGATAVAVAVASVAWSVALAGDSGIERSRLYFGADTRAVGLAVGCVAGCLWARGTHTGRRRLGRGSTAGAAIGATVLVAMMLMLEGDEEWLYGPGFALAALATLAVLYSVLGSGPCTRVLSVTPLAAIGKLSYGVYLWHWPVIVVLDERRTGLEGLASGVLWVSVTAVLAGASWALVERRVPLPTISRPGLGLVYGAVGLAVGLSAVLVTRSEDRGLDAADIVVPPGLDVTAARRPTASTGSPSSPGGASPDSPPPFIAGRRGSSAFAPSSDSSVRMPAPRSLDAGADGEADGDLTTGDERRRGASPDGERRESADGARSGSAGATPTAADPPLDHGPSADLGATGDGSAGGGWGADLVALPTDRPVRMLVLGDSVVDSLLPVSGSPMSVDGYDVELSARGVIGCPVVLEGQNIDAEGTVRSDPEGCEEGTRFAVDMDAVEPDIVLLLFGWPGTGGGRKLSDGESAFVCDPRFDRAWGDAYERLVERLAESATVVVSTVAPGQFMWEDQAPKPGCLNRELERRPFTLFDYAEWLCPERECGAYANLRPDGVHFADDAEVRAAIWPAIVGQVLAIVGAEG